MIGWLKAKWTAWRKPLVCPDCQRRCKSAAGLGRHRAAEARKKAQPAPLAEVPPGG